MNKTDIDYLDYTCNPLAMRCTPISEGCKNCWHLPMADRLAKNPRIPEEEQRAYAGGPPVFIRRRLEKLLKINKPSRIGMQFMGDLFHKYVHFDWQLEIWCIVRDNPNHIFIILTKRALAMKYFF